MWTYMLIYAISNINPDVTLSPLCILLGAYVGLTVKVRESALCTRNICNFHCTEQSRA